MLIFAVDSCEKSSKRGQKNVKKWVVDEFFTIKAHENALFDKLSNGA